MASLRFPSQALQKSPSSSVSAVAPAAGAAAAIRSVPAAPLTLFRLDGTPTLTRTDVTAVIGYHFGVED